MDKVVHVRLCVNDNSKKSQTDFNEILHVNRCLDAN